MTQFGSEIRIAFCHQSCFSYQKANLENRPQSENILMKVFDIIH